MLPMPAIFFWSIKNCFIFFCRGFFANIVLNFASVKFLSSGSGPYFLSKYSGKSFVRIESIYPNLRMSLKINRLLPANRNSARMWRGGGGGGGGRAGGAGARRAAP